MNAVKGFDARARPRRALVPRPGMVVGRYIVLDELGAGAMGVVHAGYDPQLDRKVALKFLKPRIGGNRRSARLLREAQALGKLAHPNVVGILDVGTIDGRVWLAMELVQGQTLRAWLRKPRGWREVLAVMVGAGEGLAAAHAAGLLHRDFKPDNVMVGDDGRVRVMDFGLARVGSEEASTLGDRSRTAPSWGFLAIELTRTGVPVGTPAYIAPEQSEPHRLSAAVDQFAFCVTLWEALYGARPAMTGEGPSMLRAPANGPQIPSRLRKACARGLALEPARRWPSMSALLDELRRISAPGRGRGAMLAATIAGLSVTLGVAYQQDETTLRQCTGAQEELEGIWDEGRKPAVRAAILQLGHSRAPATWERVEQRLDEYAGAWASKHTAVCRETWAREGYADEQLDLRMRCMSDRKGALRAVVELLATADANMAEHAEELVSGLPSLGRCDDLDALRAEVPPPEDPALAREVEEVRERLAGIEAAARAGVYVPARAELEGAVARAEVLGYGPLQAEVKVLRGSSREKEGRFAEAEQDLLEAYALAMQHRHDVVALAAALELTNVVGFHQMRHAEGQVWGQAALAHATRLGDRGSLALGLGSIGNVLYGQGQHEQAQRYYERALQLQEQVLGANHPGVVSSLINLGNALADRGEHEQAKRSYERALRIREAVLGTDHPAVAVIVNNLGAVLSQQGEHARAQAHLQRALEIWEKTPQASRLDVAMVLGNLGDVLGDQGVYEQAKAHYERALKIWREALGPDHPDVALPLVGLAHVALAQHDCEAARMHAERATSILEAGAAAPEQLAEARRLLSRCPSVGTTSTR